MDSWKFFDITHRDHLYCNPMSQAKFDELVALFRLKPGAQVLDIASGKGEFLVRIAEMYEIAGVGVDISPYCIADARKKQATRAPESDIQFFEMDGADYQPESSRRFDLLACLGASWIYGGYRGTVKALVSIAADKGWIVVGEPYWLREPVPEYREAIGVERETFGTHPENAALGSEFGLELTYTFVSSPDDWDKYEGLQWYAAEHWAAENPSDPDVKEVLKRVRSGRETYLKWGRQTLGWAIYVFRKGAVS